MYMTAETPEAAIVTGTVKWFDPAKGFGFIVSDAYSKDILLHTNVLRNYGQSSVADGAQITVTVHETARGVQAIEVLKIDVSNGQDWAAIADFEGLDPALFTDTPEQPARIKWFDKAKGFGFANVFGAPEDIFIHVEVLRRSGFVDLEPGEAVSIRVLNGERGKLALTVAPWDSVRH